MTSPINCELKIYEEGMFDYDKIESQKYNLLDFKKMIVREARIFKNNFWTSFPEVKNLQIDT